MGGPPAISSNDSRSSTMLLFAGGILATLALVVGIVLLWPSGDDDSGVDASATTTTTKVKDKGSTTTVEGAEGEPSEQSTTTAAAEPPDEPVDLFTSGAPEVLADLSDAAGNPTQAMEVSLYPEYAFLAYRDPDNAGNIDRRMWRAGEVGDADPNPIDDRVNADTEPSLWPLSELDLSVIAQLTGDAPSRFDLDVSVTHIIINRFLPFDRRVLIRVYASPTDGRSGGGYVQYTLDGTFVKTIQ